MKWPRKSTSESTSVQLCPIASALNWRASIMVTCLLITAAKGPVVGWSKNTCLMPAFHLHSFLQGRRSQVWSGNAQMIHLFRSQVWEAGLVQNCVHVDVKIMIPLLWELQTPPWNLFFENYFLAFFVFHWLIKVSLKVSLIYVYQRWSLNVSWSDSNRGAGPREMCFLGRLENIYLKDNTWALSVSRNCCTRHHSKRLFYSSRKSSQSKMKRLFPKPRRSVVVAGAPAYDVIERRRAAGNPVAAAMLSSVGTWQP